MKRIFISIFILFCTSIAQAQFSYFNSEAFWQKLELHHINEPEVISPNDTVIIVATNRVEDTSNFRFFPEVRDDRQIKYFVVYSGHSKWNLLPVYSLKEAIDRMPDKNKSWVVYTEGMGKFFTTDLDRGMNMAAEYGVNVLLMDYPSITAKKKRIGNYYFSKKNAAIASQDFLPVLDTVKQLALSHQLGNKGVNLFFHSMGNIVMWQIIKQGKLKVINDAKWVNNLIFNAACVPQRHHKQFLDQINFAKRIYVHYNPHDYTLGGALLLGRKNLLGMKVKQPISNKAIYINFHLIAGKAHSNFLNLIGRNEIPENDVRHYNTLFQGKAVDISDTLHYKPSEYKHIGYSLLP